MCKAELYDATDLLEPLARINFEDSTGNNHSSGGNLLGWLNLEFEDTCDFTFDNYHATGTRNTPVGFPGVPQVVNLVPKPQTLFYAIPASDKITFSVNTFSSTQINTNSTNLKLFLNDLDVTSGLTITEVGSAKTNFNVRWNGTLTSNTVYHGQIIVRDLAGTRATTNNWYFDTFGFFNPIDNSNPTHFLLVEAEDYNHDSGQFFDYPPVSGTDQSTTSYDAIYSPTLPGNVDTLGPQVGGGGSGYFGLQGVEGIDYHATQSVDAHSRSQYRDTDVTVSNVCPVTVQGTKNGGFDTPRSYRSNLVANGGSPTGLYVPDYIISDIRPGEWLNYTRTFPSGNYNVYVRASSQGRQDVRLDEVTAGSTTPSQTTVLRGQFLVPNTGGLTRFRYVPLTDAAGNLQTLALSGQKTLRLTMNQARPGVTSTDDAIGDLQLNWILFVPVSTPASSGPFLASASPSVNSDNISATPTFSFVILNRGTSVNCPASIQLRYDGSLVTPTIVCSTTEPNSTGATITYRPPGYLVPGVAHSVSLSFNDTSTTTSNQWNFTVDPNIAVLAPTDSAGGTPDTLFTVKVNKAQNGSDPTACAIQGPFENWIPRAEQQLAGQLIDGDSGNPYPNEAAGTSGGFYTEPTAIQFEQCGGIVGFFGQSKPYPGIPTVAGDGSWDCGGGTTPDHFAIAANIKLQLGPGAYRMGVNSDDNFKLTAGGTDGKNVFIAQSANTLPGTRGDGQFDFVVPSSGIYNFRLVQEEGEGGAFVEWYWVNRNTGARELVRPLELLSSATVGGPYSYDATALIDPGSKTITVPKSGNTRFYRILSSTGYTLNKPTVSGNNIVLTYQ